MITILRKGIRYFNTVRYLRLIQIFGRIYKRFKPLKFNYSLHEGQNEPINPWISSPDIPQCMFGKKKFCFLNVQHQIIRASDWNNKKWSKLWLYNLHYFNDLNAVDAKKRSVWHSEIINCWVKENPPGHGIGWEPYPTSIRIVNWIKWSLANNNLTQENEDSLVVQVRFLSKNTEIHLLGNHLFANGKALLFAGLFFQGNEARGWYQQGLEIIEKQLKEQVLSDGGHFELSTMYHSIFVEDLLDLVNIHKLYNQKSPKGITETIPRMLYWLIGMCHSDGEISFFNDAAFGITPSTKELLDYSHRLGFPEKELNSSLIEFRPSGYSRVTMNDYVALIDRAIVGPDYLPGHAHADTLSFELSLFGQRVIVNSGTSVYGNEEERQRQRGTSAHSTVVIDDEDSSEVWSGFRVGRRAQVFNINSSKLNEIIKLSASHNGYKRLPGRPVHSREWTFSKNKILVKDLISSKRNHKIDIIIPLHPNIKLSRQLEGKAFLKFNRREFAIEFVGLGKLFINKSSYHPEFGLSIENLQLVYSVSSRLSTEVLTKIGW